jgi:hypothetical protein
MVLVVMEIPRFAAGAVLTLRIAYGVALMAAPRRLAHRWLGPDAERAPTQVALRGLGAREVVLHTGALLALSRGASVRPWLAASAAGDLTDVVATAAGRHGLPPGSAPATLAVGGGSALVSLAVAVAADS